MIGQTIPQDVSTVAKAFIALQQKRHEADYDLNRSLTRRDTLKLIDQAEAAIQAGNSLTSNTVGRIYLTALLVGMNVRS
jgi:hypothetical protein